MVTIVSLYRQQYIPVNNVNTALNSWIVISTLTCGKCWSRGVWSWSSTWDFEKRLADSKEIEDPLLCMYLNSLLVYKAMSIKAFLQTILMANWGTMLGDSPNISFWVWSHMSGNTVQLWLHLFPLEHWS